MIPMFWSGYGFLVPLITFASMIFTQMGTEALFHDTYYQTTGWPRAMAMIVAAAVLYALSERLDTRVVVDEQTGERIELRRRHTFFFIPMKVWAIVLVVLGCAAPFLMR